MLIIPVGRQPDWRRPPLVTLLLILVNFLIYFGLQSGEEKRGENAYRYYAASTLREIELPRYVAELTNSGRAGEAALARSALARGEWAVVLSAMENDRRFMPMLREGKVVAPQETIYQSWRRQRDEFDRREGPHVVARYGFRPAEPSFVAALAHMFLHGGFDHLLGNMALLFIVGSLVEEALGKARFFTFYLFSGLGAVAFDLVFNVSSSVPGIGASGAVAGVMAMFVGIYGWREMRFFAWLPLSFDFLRAPAIIVLPGWIANGLYQHYFNHGSPVNYLAHLGGFITGAALIAAQRSLSKHALAAPASEMASDPLRLEMAKIDRLLTALRVDEARKALHALAIEHPHELLILRRYYTVARHAPASEDFHHAAALIFALPDDHSGSDQLIYETFVDYLNVAKPAVHFNPRQLATLVRRLSRSGHVDDAERLLRVLSKRAPQEVQLPGLLLAVAEGFRRSGNRRMREATLERLHSEFPQSAEARSAALIGEIGLAGGKS